MDRKNLLLAALFLLAGNAWAQDTGKVISLLPTGVKVNIDTDRKWGKQKDLVVVGSKEKGYKAFFAASDGEHGEELWVTDGTKEGTHLVKDINIGSSTSNPSYLGRLNDKVLFAADEGNNEGLQLWISDGTEEGTKLLKAINPLGSAEPKGFCQVNEHQAIFTAIDEESATYNDPSGATDQESWLWVTDGTEEGTYRIKDVNVQIPGMKHENMQTPYCRVGRKVYFKGKTADDDYGEELWITDGTENGTYMVKDIRTDPDETNPLKTLGSHLDNFENYNNELLFFTCWTKAYGHEVWRSDGTDEGTFIVKDLNPTVNPTTGEGDGCGPFGCGWEVYKDCILLRAMTPETGYELAAANLKDKTIDMFDIFKGYATNADGTQSINNSYPDPGCIFDGVYMFCAATGFDATKPDNYGGEMMYFDGSEVKLQKDFVPGVGCDWVKEPTVAGGSLYWYNEDNSLVGSGFGSGLYRLDSKDATPVVCNTITSTGDFVNTLKNLGGTIIYTSNTQETKGLYAYEYTKPGWDGVSDMGYLEPDFGGKTDGIKEIAHENDLKGIDVYTIDGVLLRHNVSLLKSLEGLAKGIYIVNGKKVIK